MLQAGTTPDALRWLIIANLAGFLFELSGGAATVVEVDGQASHYTLGCLDGLAPGTTRNESRHGLVGSHAYERRPQGSGSRHTKSPHSGLAGGTPAPLGSA